jgi:hypothetical protein
MMITIQNQQFDTRQITQLYPAALIDTGCEGETAPMSLEWLDTESQGRVQVVGYGLFVHMGREEKHSFVYETRAALEEAVTALGAQLRGEASGA